MTDDKIVITKEDMDYFTQKFSVLPDFTSVTIPTHEQEKNAFIRDKVKEIKPKSWLQFRLMLIGAVVR